MHTTHAVRLILMVAVAWLLATPDFATTSVRDHGAVGDGKADDSEAFRKALDSSEGEVLVPAGRYVIAEVKIPDGIRLRGVGARSIIAAPASAGFALSLGSDCSITDLTFVGDPEDKAPPVQSGIIHVGSVHDVTLERLTFKDVPRGGIVTDHAVRFRISDCRFENMGVAVSIQFSRQGMIRDNFVDNCKVHGLQFWGNWKWELMDCADLIFTGNVLRDAGGGPIWGTGARRVVIANNVVDGATDVGLDLEWCEDSTIAGNTVRRAFNAGISLFFACRNVTITGNTILNDLPISDEDAKATWWVRSGIWLTPPNREEFKGDHGHEDIAIVGNTIRCAEGKGRRAMWIGSEVKNVRIEGNAVSGGPIVYGGHHAVHPLQLETLEQSVTLDRRPTPDKPKF